MSIFTAQSPDPEKCVIRTYPDDDRYSFLETTYGPMELARLIGELSAELSRMHQYAGERRRRELRDDL